MRNYKIEFVALILAATFSSCAMQKTLLLSTPAVSMSEASFESGKKYSPAGEIQTRYCKGEDPLSSPKSEQNVGMMDEVVYRAQKESGARYIANAQFFNQGNCMLLEGTSMK